jgi:predicted transcriptional regulator of viral defense system
MRDSFEMALAIFRVHDGLLRTGQAKRLGIDPKTIAEMTDAGLLDKLGRGLYRLAELPPLDYPDLVQVALRVPKAVICLVSALAFHDLTTQVPHRVNVALPQSVRRPRLKMPPLDVVWLSEEAYEYAMETHKLDGVDVPIYSKEKTVADCFKFRNKIGLDVAIEALKDYVGQGGVDVQALLDCARVDRVEKVIEPYLEAVLT